MDRFSRSFSHVFPRLRSPASGVLAALLVIAPVVGHATLLDVSINTTAYDGTDGFVAFDFIDGDWLINNGVTVSNFYTDGTLGTAIPSGSVSGSLVSPDSLTLTDVDFYNSWSQGIQFGTTIDFTLELTEQVDGAGFFPDSFAVFLLDNSSSPLFFTTDYADALFAVDIDGTSSGDLQVFAATNTSLSVGWSVQSSSTVSTVPIPGSIWLFTSAIFGGIAARRLQRKHPRMISTLDLGIEKELS